VTSAALSYQAAERRSAQLVRRIERVDPFLLVATLLLIGYGLVMTYSATFEDRTLGTEASQFVVRGVVWAALGLAAMVVIAYADYRWFATAAPLLYLLALVMLVAILVFGRATLGAQRALVVAGQNVQVSELAKILVIVVLAKYFADRRDRIGSPATLIGGLVLLGPPAYLVFRQPDLGTTLVFLAIFVGVAFIAGARPWQLATLAGIGIAALPVVWTLMKDYQRARLVSFLDPYSDPLGSGWNIIQSLIAVGSGGFFGKGLTAGTQSPLGYLPIAESDFIFANLAEDLGFVGALVLFALYLVVLLAALRIAFRAPDTFGALVGAGVVSMLGFQIFVNVGMAISIMPVTGIPLPFISHGGSSLVSICAALGLLQSVSMRSD
jgi:rod shape determining protein RodA